MFIGAILVLLITIGFGVYSLLSNLDSLVKSAIETYGSEATQTSVRVDNVKIVLQDGSGAIRGLTIGNPNGFATPNAFSLGEIATQIDLKSLSEDVPVIEHITIRAPEVFFELNEKGQNNLDKLKSNLQSGASTSSSSSSAKSGGSEPKLIIRKLIYSGGNIYARVAPTDKDYELKLPNIQMNDLGGKTGATPSQIASQALKVLTDRALAEIKKKGIDQYKAQLEGEVNKRLDAEKDKVGDKLKGVLGY
ncbi:MAG: AsmA family protein [Deltaproteobacteria bacterium]|nr:AsmA family protein [Deltaproteobacteria bacterium]